MTEITLRVHRPWTERYEDEAGRLALHQQRASLLHGLVDALQIEVKDWGETDAAYPREDVTLIMDIASIIVPALVSIINTWMTSQKVKKIEIKQSDGTFVLLEGVSRSDLKTIHGIIGQ
jgi:hypothetical protein